MAIILVIVGHEFQRTNLVFDDSVGFRIIYSFHMPLFILISGMATSFMLKNAANIENIKGLLAFYSKRIGRSFARLMIPFASWSIIGYYLNHRYESGDIGDIEKLAKYLNKVIHMPDWSLWFLVCIFYCIVTISTVELVIKIIYFKFKIQKPYLRGILILLSGIYISSLLHRLQIRTTEFGVGFLIGNFLYFTIGYILCKPIIAWVMRLPLIALAVALFVSLAPFWYRTTPFQLAIFTPDYLLPLLSNKLYAIIVALAGSTIILSVAAYLSKKENWIATRILAYCGTLSLGIYASHFYFLGHTPALLGPFACSILITVFIQRIPGARVLLLGEMRK